MNYGYLPGTSFASPHVAGLAALYASQNRLVQAPGVPQQIIRAIEKGCQQGNARTDGGSDPYFGYGLIDCYATLNGINAREATVGGCIGQVTVAGSSLGNVPVNAVKEGTTRVFSTGTYPDGIFHFVNLPAGRYTRVATGAAPAERTFSRQRRRRPRWHSSASTCRTESQSGRRPGWPSPRSSTWSSGDAAP